MTGRYLIHLTLDTGHQRRSYRDEVADDVIALLRPLIDRVVAGERVAIPADVEPAGCTMTGAVGRKRGLLVTVWGPPAADTGERAPVVTIGVAPSSLASAELWRTWRDDDAGDPPSPPWCCVELQPGIAAHPDASTWLGDLERCIAWSWID